MKVTHYHTSGPIPGVCEQHAIWCRGKGTETVPLVFLQRPKWVKDDEAWQKVVEAVSLKLPRGFEVK